MILMFLYTLGLKIGQMKLLKNFLLKNIFEKHKNLVESLQTEKTLH